MNSADTAEVENYNLMFMAHLQDLHFQDYIEDFLDNVFIKGSDKRINLDEDLDSASDIFKLFAEVASVNFIDVPSISVFQPASTNVDERNRKVTEPNIVRLENLVKEA